jgi:hypothetical protein
LAVCLILVLPAAAVPTPDVDGVRAAGSAVPRVDDPAADGWRTESLNKSVGRQLKHIAHFLEASGSDDVLAELQTIASPVFSAGPLRPAESTTVYDSTYLRVEKEVGEAVEKAPGGSDDLASALRPLLDAVEGANEIHVKFKVVGVDVSSRPAVTEQLFSMNGRTPRGAVEIHSSWTAAWEPGEQGEPLLVRIDSSGYQESHVSGLAGTTLFSDCTRSVLEGNDSFEEQLLRGPDHWLSRLEAAMGTDIMGHSGLAVGDVNGDGLEDLYMPQQGGLPNRLYVQNQDGSVSDRSAWAGVDWLDRSLSALLVDLDNDGDQDLVVGSMPGLLLAENLGDGRFELRATLAEARYAYSFTAADYDRDGDLDIYANRYNPVRDDPVDESVDVPKPIPYHDAQNGAPNVLVRNDGDWTFSNATAETGLDTDNRRWSFAAAWEDFDNDGDQDLYVANDFGRNALYRNEGGRFENIAAAAGVEDTASGMSAAWGDVNRDGLMDLYVGNMFSSAGNRITNQPGFRPGRDADVRLELRRMAKGNSLFLANDNGRFREVAHETGVEMGRWAWSSLFADLNNDGWQDIVVANGFLTADNPDDL